MVHNFVHQCCSQISMDLIGDYPVKVTAHGPMDDYLVKTTALAEQHGIVGRAVGETTNAQDTPG